MNSNGGVTASSTVSSTVTVSNGNSTDDSTAVGAAGSCARPAAAREYAFVDCSEVYLAGKRNTGIYEIW